MKPLGMTASFQIVQPTIAQDAIWDAVQTAVIHGMTPEQFKREAIQAFEHEYAEMAKHAATVLNGK